MIDVHLYFREGHDPGDEDRVQAVRDEMVRCMKDPVYAVRTYLRIKEGDGSRPPTQAETQSMEDLLDRLLREGRSKGQTN